MKSYEVTAPPAASPHHPHSAQPGPSPKELAPPFVLPGEHFTAGLLWLMAGAAGLVAVAPTLAAGGFLAPRVVAVTHCFTLGWITTSIFGALYQIFPIALGVPARSVRAGHVTFAVLQLGIGTLVAGTWAWQPLVIAAGWVVITAAVGGLAWNVLPQRRRAPRGRIIGLYVSGGHMGLGLAMLVVAARIGSALGWWGLDRMGFLSAHVHLAVVGFATLTVVGVGSRLLPMFLLSRETSEAPLRWIGPLTGAGLVVFSVGELAAQPVISVPGGLLIAAGTILYLQLASGYFIQRTRRVLDPGLGHAAAAFGWLAVAVVLGLIVLFAGGSHPRLQVAYALSGILGWLSLLVVGMYHKIVPFLTWLHRYSDRVGQPGVPRIADITSAAAGWITLGLLVTGVVILVAGVLSGSEKAAQAGAGCFAAGTAVLLAQHARLVTR